MGVERPLDCSGRRCEGLSCSGNNRNGKEEGNGLDVMMREKMKKVKMRF